MAKGKAKKVEKLIKLQIPAGKANPAPPIGPALGAAGLNIMDFCKNFNARTQDKGGEILPVEITVYKDKSYDFITKEPPTAKLILGELGIKGSACPNRDKVGTLTGEQLEKIAKRKYPDFKVRSLESAKRMVAGTAKSMGVDVEV